jgi:hypothetical protein
MVSPALVMVRLFPGRLLVSLESAAPQAAMQKLRRDRVSISCNRATLCSFACHHTMEKNELCIAPVHGTEHTDIGSLVN